MIQYTSNEVRKEFVLSKIMDLIYKIKRFKNKEIIVGVYRLVMKINSDDFRNTAIGYIIEELKNRKIQLIVYEPLLEEIIITENYSIIGDIEEFKRNCDLIIANRYHTELDDVAEKVYTRDLFFRD